MVFHVYILKIKNNSNEKYYFVFDISKKIFPLVVNPLQKL